MILREGDRNSTVATIQEWLNFLGYKYKNPKGTYERLTVDGDFGAKTVEVLMDFQKSMGILVDGIVGPQTMKTLEQSYTQRVLELNSPGIDFADGYPDRHTLEKVYADPYNEGYPRLSLRNDVAAAYNEVRKEVIAKGGILTSSGGIRSLHAKVTANRSAVSFHYVGLALDLYIYSAMVDPKTDPYVVQKDKDRYHTLFARCKKDWPFNPDDTPTNIKLPAKKMVIDNVVTYKQRDVTKNKPVEDYFINLTEIFEKHGFKRIRARARFYDGSSMMGAEWWHFQYEKGLVPMVSKFGDELLKLYSEDTLKTTPPWEQRNRVFGLNWF